MRVLFLSTPVATHFTPLIPLVWAFRAAGHETLVAAQPDVTDGLAGNGLTGLTLGERFNVDNYLRGRFAEFPGRRFAELTPRPAEENMGAFAVVWWRNATRMLPLALDAAREFRPDLIVSDQLEFSSLLLGDILGVPVVHHRWGVDPISTAGRPRARAMMGELAREHGISGLREPDVILDPCPPSLQLPWATPGTPIRYVHSNGGGLVPGWVTEDGPADSRKVRRVAVSMGTRTLELDGIPLVRAVLRAFDGLPDTEAVATVPEHLREAFGPLPGNVRLIDPVPLQLFLDRCDALVHHGGAGTSMNAIRAGLPQLVLPQMSDQFWHADQLAASGAALQLAEPFLQTSVPRLRSLLDRLTGEERYAKAAAQLRDEADRMPSPARVVADLEQLA